MKLALSLLSLLFAHNTLAAPCVTNPSTSDVKREAKLSDEVRKKIARTSDEILILFPKEESSLFGSKSTVYSVENSVSVSLPERGKLLELPSEVLSKIQKHPNVRVYRRTNYPIYFTSLDPRALKSEKSPLIEPLCEEARSKDRVLRPERNDLSCGSLSLRDMKRATLLYSSLAENCDNLLAIQSKREKDQPLNEYDEANLKKALNSFNLSLFGTQKGPMRSVSDVKAKPATKTTTESKSGSSRPSNSRSSGGN